MRARPRSAIARRINSAACPAPDLLIARLFSNTRIFISRSSALAVAKPVGKSSVAGTIQPNTDLIPTTDYTDGTDKDDRQLKSANTPQVFRSTISVHRPWGIRVHS